MVLKEIIIKNKSGLQSKSAAVFIQKAANYKSSIWIEKHERKANAKSLLGLLSLSIGKGERIAVIVSGEDESKAAEELEEYLKSDSAEVI
ncbi:MAG: HPr family phosphocarrier protein [Ruminiclostridium sp.]|nr:HPr family phosphocarrier protein [Ruminiclostridium sp.]